MNSRYKCSSLKPSSARFDILVGLGFGVLWVRHFDEGGVREPVEHAKPHDKVAGQSLLCEGQPPVITVFTSGVPEGKRLRIAG